MRRFEPGESVALREIWKGRIWTARPALVVADDPDELTFYGAPGMRWMAPRAPGGGGWLRLPQDDWELAERTWRSYRWLSFATPGRPHAALLMWSEGWAPRDWYVNLEDALRRTGVGFDYLDLELDAIVELDGSGWSWKDEDELAEAVRRGNISASRAEELRSEGEALVRRILHRRTPFDRDWTSWRPDPSWPLPSLPSAWAVEPVA